MKKKLVLGASVLAIAALVLYFSARQRLWVMDAPVLGAEAVRALVMERTPLLEEQIELKIDGVAAAYEKKEERYYVPRNLQEDYWKGSLSASVNGLDAGVAWAEDPAFSDIRTAVQEEHEFSCLVYTDTGCASVSVLFTGMPLMSIQGEMGEQGTRISVFDPVQSLGGGYQAEESLAYYNIRGNASKRFEKIGYRVEFFHEDGSAGKDLSLLGMRSDNDWQLKALYSDRSKLRDKLSIELWNQIADQTPTQADQGCKMEFLELMVNGEYRGLYGLVEPTDYKSLGLNKERDLIYKMGADQWPSDQLFDESEAAQSFTCAGVSIRQADKRWYPGIWEPFRIFWNSGYEMEGPEDLAALYSCIDRQNFIDYHLYYNAIAGMDNRFKNIIYSAELKADGSFLIRRIPWDQNYSWGDDFASGDEKDIKNICYNPELSSRWLNEEVFRNMQAQDPELSEDMLSTWERWRESFLKEEEWKTYARRQMEYLTGSGAFERDTRRWPDSENQEGTAEIEAFIDARFQWMDQYLKELAE